MSPLALRRRLGRLRGNAAVVACVLALGGAVAVHHFDMPMHDDGMHGMAAVVMCLGVLGLATVALAGAPKLGRLLTAHPRPRASRAPAQPNVFHTVARPARAGPPLFLRLAVLRH